MKIIINLFSINLITQLMLFFYLSSCSNRISKNIEIDSELLGISDLIIGNPLQIGIVSDFFLIKSAGNDTWFTLINLENPKNKNYKTGYVGQGPGEIGSPGQFLIFKNKFSVLNSSNKQLITFHLDSIFNIDKYIPKGEPVSLKFRAISNMVNLDNSHYVINEVSSEYRFTIVDSLGKDIFHFGEFPKEALQTGFDPIYISNVAYQSELTSNVNRSIIASATRYGEYIEFTFIDIENKQAKLINRHMGQLPDYNNDNLNGVPNFALNDKTIAGYLSITSNDEFIYALYSGKIIRSPNSDAYISNLVQVFNWEGDFLYQLELDREYQR